MGERSVLRRMREVTLNLQVRIDGYTRSRLVRVLLARPLCLALGHEYSRIKYEGEGGWCDYCGKRRPGVARDVAAALTHLLDDLVEGE